MPPRDRSAAESQRRPRGPIAAGRAAWGTISREDIVQAAVKILQAGDYESMTMRSLAAGLGVSPMALYRHIDDKDDLLDEVVDRLLAKMWRPAAAEGDWQAWLIEAAVKLRHFLVGQPAALHVYLRHPVVSAAALDRMNAMVDVLRSAGLDEQAADSAYGALHTYTVGFAALEASRSRWIPADGQADVSRHLAGYTGTDQFVAGLRYMLEGIARNFGHDGR